MRSWGRIGVEEEVKHLKTKQTNTSNGSRVENAKANERITNKILFKIAGAK